MKKYSPFFYYLQLCYYKIRIPFDCYEGRLRLILSEFIHAIDAIFKVWWEMPGYTVVRNIKTVWGKFYFPGTMYCYLIVNPSFERPDIEYLISRLKEYLLGGEKVAFFDIGANIGVYSVGLSNRLKTSALIIHAFEPESKYFSLLQKNVRINGVPNMYLHKMALGNRNGKMESDEFIWPGHPIPVKKEVFPIHKLDDVLTGRDLSPFDRIVVKMDIEGHEAEALKGAKKFFRIKKPMLLLIEDCLHPDILRQLHSYGFRFLGKITPYNSFWEIPQSHEQKTRTNK